MGSTIENVIVSMNDNHLSQIHGLMEVEGVLLSNVLRSKRKWILLLSTIGVCGTDRVPLVLLSS
jgi:hypothetical protein